MMPFSRNRLCPIRPAGYSLIEIMIAMALLTLIVVGLLTTLTQTQKALKFAGSQTDTLENGRAFMSMLSRELQEIAETPGVASNTFRFYSVARGGVMVQDVEGLGKDARENRLYSFGFIQRARESNSWRFISYEFDRRDVGEQRGVADLYRVETNCVLWALTNAGGLTDYQTQKRINGYSSDRNNYESNYFRKVLSGVAHLSFKAYDTNGFVIPEWTRDQLVGYVVTNALPAVTSIRPVEAIEVEVGILDPDTYRRVKSMPDSATVLSYLKDRPGNIQIFRQRIKISTGQ